MNTNPETQFVELQQPIYAFESWFGFLAPAGTPPAVGDKLKAAINKALAVTEVKARLWVLGVTPTPRVYPEIGRISSRAEP